MTMSKSGGLLPRPSIQYEPPKASSTPRSGGLRLSVRAALLLVAVIGVLPAPQVNIARKQRAVVSAIQRAGGWVHYDYEFQDGELRPGKGPWTTIWLGRLLGYEFFQNVRQVNLVYDDSSGKRLTNDNAEPCDGLLERISSLTDLKELLLKETQVTDEGLRHIGKMTGLEYLSIWNAYSVTDSGVAHLKNLKNLKTIHISNSNLTDKSLVVLSSLQSMEVMSLQHNHFTDEGLARMKGKDRLTRLHIGLGALGVTDAGLAALKDFQKLEILDIQNSHVTGQGLEQLKELPNLRELWLGETKTVSEEEMRRLQDALPHLRIRH